MKDSSEERTMTNSENREKGTLFLIGGKITPGKVSPIKFVRK